MDIADRIASFPVWHYEIDLQGHLTPIRDPAWANRHRQRRDYMIPPLAEAAGGSLAGMRVLDLGCNAGYWSLQAIEHGADFVLGVDGRRMHVEQAELVFEARNVDPARYRFLESNLFDLDLAALGDFDVVLCLGLLYHVRYPMELMEMTARAREVALVDTTIWRTPEPVLVLVEDIPLEDPRAALDRRLVMWPSAAAVRRMAEAAGFRTVRELEPRFTDYTGAEDYRDGDRRAFLLSKREPPPERSGRPKTIAVWDAPRRQADPPARAQKPVGAATG
jgi:tRNA (mo5U34)-methyltransferase